MDIKYKDEDKVYTTDEDLDELTGKLLEDQKRTGACWQYRVRKRIFTHANGEKEEWYDIVEVHFHNEEDYQNNKPYGWTDNANVARHNLNGLKNSLEMMLKALERPILDEEEQLIRLKADDKK